MRYRHCGQQQHLASRQQIRPCYSLLSAGNLSSINSSSSCGDFWYFRWLYCCRRCFGSLLRRNSFSGICYGFLFRHYDIDSLSSRSGLWYGIDINWRLRIKSSFECCSCLGSYFNTSVSFFRNSVFNRLHNNLLTITSDLDILSLVGPDGAVEVMI